MNFDVENLRVLGWRSYLFVLESVSTVLIDFLLLLYREETSGLGI